VKNQNEGKRVRGGLCKNASVAKLVPDRFGAVKDMRGGKESWVPERSGETEGGRCHAEQKHMAVKGHDSNREQGQRSVNQTDRKWYFSCE